MTERHDATRLSGGPLSAPDHSVHAASEQSTPTADRAMSAPGDLRLERLLALHGLRIFYGDLHNHTSYSDGTGTPADALRQMRARGLDFAAVTDHGENLGSESHFDKWGRIAEAVARANEEDAFLALRGFEWSPDTQGHVNVWSSAQYTNWRQTGDASMRSFYEWLATAEAAPGRRLFAGFNHPLVNQGICRDGHYPALDERVVVAECFNRGRDYGEGYFRLLDGGWHVGAIGSSDHHGEDWGDAQLPRTGVLAAALTLDDLEKALLARRTFAVNRPALNLVLAGGGELMGARLTLGADEQLELEAWFDEAGDSPGESAHAQLQLWTNGGRCVATTVAHDVAMQVKWRHVVAPQAGGGEKWFVVRAVRDDEPVAYSSPVWARWGGHAGARATRSGTRKVTNGATRGSGDECGDGV